MSLTKSFICATQWITRIGGTLLLSSLPRLRAAAGAGAKPKIEPAGSDLKMIEVNGIPCEITTPPDAPNDACLLYFHGGGGVLGLYNSCRKIIGYTSSAAKLRSCSVDYRLAPEHPFPNGMEDCVAAYRWLLEEGYPAKRIVMLGDSMGGYLTISTLLALRDKKVPLPAGAVCISPVVDPTCSGESMQTNAGRDALLSPKFMRTVMSLYAGDHTLDDPYLSPLTADLTGLPPILIQVGEHEILLDDARRFYEYGVKQGKDVRLEIWPTMWHDWHVCAPALKESNQAIGKIAEFIHSVIDK